ncbi:MAG: hypothetical protein F6K40_16025, partial [Okeania sp. SIO3I5]|nr:hypothetical protein [Okeania sp. SIO3I5]
MENFYYQSQRKTEDFFDTVKIAESEEKGIRKIRRFRQTKVSTRQRGIYIYGEFLLP